MATKKAQPGITGIEPSRMTVPAMDRPSIALGWFLDRMVIENRNTSGDWEPVLVCTICQGEVCDVDDGDTLRVLFNTALAHTCGE